MNSQRLIDRFLRYVKCDSESGKERQFCELIEADLKSIGFEVSRDDAGVSCGSNGWNVYGCLSGEGEPILFSSHMDTVAPGEGINPVVSDGVIRSSGDTILGADDKSGIAAVMEAAESLQEQGARHRPIEVFFSICEEIGLLGAKHADYSRITSKEAVVLDSGFKNCVINRAPANIHLYFTIIGKSAHAAVSPEKGIHAAKAAAKAITLIPCGYVDDQTVINISNLLSPGKTNVIPARATFDIEIRSFDEELLYEHVRRVEQAVTEACEEFGADYELKKELLFGLLHVPEESPLLKRLIDVYEDLGVELTVEKSYGGSDAACLFQNGINALNIGTGMADGHSTDESIAIEDLEITARAMERMMSAVSGLS